ncbi:MAG: metalloregulator ArsR/SmtB family transcription factor [Nannocystaceae bacterium]
MAGNAQPSRNLTDDGFAAVARQFRLLSEPIRLKILHGLQDGAKNVGALVALVGSSQANVSKHLGLLREEGMVSRSKRGNEAIYAIADPRLFTLCKLVCASIEERLTSRHDRLFDGP